MYTRSSFQKAVYDSVNLRKDKIINMRDLGKQFYGEENENKFFEFAVNNDLTIDPEFKRDSKRWKGLVTIIATIPGITLNVDYLKINSEEFKAEDETIIIKSKKLVDQIKKQYEQQRNS